MPGPAVPGRERRGGARRARSARRPASRRTRRSPPRAGRSAAPARPEMPTIGGEREAAVAAPAQRADELRPRHRRHHLVDEPQVGRRLARERERVLARLRLDRVEPGALDDEREEPPDEVVVIHDEDAQRSPGIVSSARRVIPAPRTRKVYTLPVGPDRNARRPPRFHGTSARCPSAGGELPSRSRIRERREERMVGEHIRALKDGRWVHAIDCGDETVLHLVEEATPPRRTPGLPAGVRRRAPSRSSTSPIVSGPSRRRRSSAAPTAAPRIRRSR